MPHRDVVELLLNAGRTLLEEHVLGTSGGHRRRERKRRGPILQSVDPVLDSTEGGVEITLRGKGLRRVRRVLFGDVSAEITGREGDTVIKVTSPLLSEFDFDALPLGVALTLDTDDGCGCHGRSHGTSDPLTFTYGLPVPPPDVTEFREQQILPGNLLPNLPGARFGASCALSSDGNTLAVGSPGENDETGAVYIFVRRSGETTWRLTDRISRADGTRSQQGFSLSLSERRIGTTSVLVLAVGCPTQQRAFENQGQVDIYQRNETGRWITETALTDTTEGSSRLGTSVSLSADGETLAVGGPEANGGQGVTLIWEHSSGQWVLNAKLRDTVNTQGARQGTSVSVSSNGGTVAVGGPGYHDTSSPRTGAVWIYERGGATWPSNPNPSKVYRHLEDGIGSSVALHGAGTVVLMGGRGPTGSTGRRGVFLGRRGPTSWVSETERVTDPSNSPQPNPEFGRSISISRDASTVVIGTGLDAPQQRRVFAYIFSGKPPRLLVRIPAIDADLKNPDPSYGTSTALSGNGTTLAIGAPGNGADAIGRVFIYNR